MFNQYAQCDLSLPERRKFLQQMGLGFGSLAFATLPTLSMAMGFMPCLSRSISCSTGTG